MLAINGRAEAGQDHFAFEFCGRKPNGVFLDIGCAEPIRWNNTYALEEVGWRGWLIDISGEFAEACRSLRKSPFLQADATLIDWSKLQIKELDYLSLDVDENQNRDRALTVLRGLIHAGIIFRCATVEHDAYRYGNEPKNSIRSLFSAAGYVLAHPDVEIRKGNGKPFEDWWIRP